jgi:hypothetical protein
MTFGIHVGHVGGPLGELRRLWRLADASGLERSPSAPCGPRAERYTVVAVAPGEAMARLAALDVERSEA